MAKRIGADRERQVRDLEQALGAELTTLRVKSALSQARLSELTGYDESYLRQLEKGTKSPTLRTVATLARAFSMRASEFIRRAERRLPAPKQSRL